MCLASSSASATALCSASASSFARCASALRFAAASASDHGAGATGMGTFLDLYNQFAERGADLAQIQNEPLRSLLTVPFQAEGRVTGMLAVAAAEPDRFAETDLARVQQVADAVAEVVHRHPHHPGAAKLRPYLEDRADTRSVLEDRFLAFCDRAGLARPQFNVYVCGFLVDALSERSR